MVGFKENIQRNGRWLTTLELYKYIKSLDFWPGVWWFSTDISSSNIKSKYDVMYNYTKNYSP